MLPPKSSVAEIRARFDANVENFSNLETGQTSTVDAPLAMQLVVESAAATTPHATHLLDVGCGAGNYTLKLLQALPNLNVTLIDLSQPMLQRAEERIRPNTTGSIQPLQGDIREVPLTANSVDIVIASAVLHHLRTEAEWHSVFEKLFSALRSGGSLWIFDLIEHELPTVQKVMWRHYGEYLRQLKDEAYRDHVFNYIDHEDTPRSLQFQLDLLRRVGFAKVDVLHKNTCFAAFGAVKA